MQTTTNPVIASVADASGEMLALEPQSPSSSSSSEAAMNKLITWASEAVTRLNSEDHEVRDRLREAIAIARATPPSLPIDFKQATDQGGRRPIATAPKDGTVIVVYATGQNDEGDDGPCVEVACWSKDVYGFMPHDEDEAEALRPCVLDPSHWMPVIGDNFAPQSGAAPTLQGVADGDAMGGKSGGAA